MKGLTQLTILILSLWLFSTHVNSNARLNSAPCLDDKTCLTGNEVTYRSALTYAYLNGEDEPKLVNYRHYAVPEKAAEPSNVFQGKLRLTGQENTKGITEVGNNNNLKNYAKAAQLPEFDFEFIQSGSDLIPVRRGLISTSHPSWEYILEPGRVWDEKTDLGYSRASFPFALQERNANCTWNGVMSFLFNNAGSVSKVSYQIAAETCLYLKFNMWGRLNGNYTAYEIKAAPEIIAGYQNEVSGRMPVKPISQLAIDYPESGVVSANLGSNQDPEHMTLFGVAYNGVHYVGGCETRYGTYPFCEVMDIPSYSTSKTTFGALGLMRLEHLYPGNQKSLKVSDWIPECSESNWGDVTFEDVLDMATGNYTSPKSHVDESSVKKLNDFFEVDKDSQLIDFACHYPRKSKPGSRFVYHTSDTYILGRAMNRYYQSKTSKQHDFWRDELVQNLWKPLGLSPTMMTTKRTYDDTYQPFTGYGLTYHRDDVVKLAEFINKDAGKIKGRPMLDNEMLTSSLQLGQGGLVAAREIDKYNNGLWYYDINGDKSVDYACSSATWIPYMSGYGGISIVLLPNNMIYYHFSDNNSFTWGNSAKELHKISPLCT